MTTDSPKVTEPTRPSPAALGLPGLSSLLALLPVAQDKRGPGPLPIQQGS